VIVDLSNLEFIASLGLGQLVRLAVAVRNKGGLFRLCGAQGGILTAIIKSKLNELMPVFRDIADAEK
jgi:anti-anti-sigma factor